jgi:hypothetical protein
MLTTQGCNNIVTSWLYRTCRNNLATSLIISTSLLQVIKTAFSKLVTEQLGTSSANTTWWWLVGRLATRCETFACVQKTHARPKIFVLVGQFKLFLHCIGSVFASFAERYDSSVNNFLPRPISPSFFLVYIYQNQKYCRPVIWKSEQAVPPVNNVGIASCCLLDAILNHELNPKLLRLVFTLQWQRCKSHLGRMLMQVFNGVVHEGALYTAHSPLQSATLLSQHYVPLHEMAESEYSPFWYVLHSLLFIKLIWAFYNVCVTGQLL